MSVIMHQGYTLPQPGFPSQCADWTLPNSPLRRFRSAEESTDIDWGSRAVSEMETDFLRHLHASGSRNSWWRLLRRLINRLKNSLSVMLSMCRTLLNEPREETKETANHANHRRG